MEKERQNLHIIHDTSKGEWFYSSLGSSTREKNSHSPPPTHITKMTLSGPRDGLNALPRPGIQPRLLAPPRIV